MAGLHALLFRLYTLALIMFSIPSPIHALFPGGMSFRCPCFPVAEHCAGTGRRWGSVSHDKGECMFLEIFTECVSDEGSWNFGCAWREGEG